LDVGAHSFLWDLTVSVSSEVASHFREEDESLRVATKRHLPLLALVDHGVYKAEDKLHQEYECDNAHNAKSDHQPSEVFILNCYQDERQNHVPEDILKDVDKFDPAPLLLQLRLLILVIVKTLCPPGDVVRAAEGVYVEDDEVAWSVEEVGNSSESHFN
jgi:hypothetical protein